MARHQVTVTVNGEAHTREVDSRLLLVHLIRDELALTGTPHRLRHHALRRVHLADRWRAHQVVHRPGRPGRRHRHRHGRRACRRRRHERAAGGLPAGARPAVRLLHPRHADHRDRAARKQFEPQRGRDPGSNLRESLPLHRIREHRQGGRVRRRQNRRRRRGGGQLMANGTAKPRTSAKICGMGHSMKRKEDPRFLQGKGNYIDDHTLPGMLWLDIVQQPDRLRQDCQHRLVQGARRSTACSLSSRARTSRRTACTGCRRSCRTPRWCCRPIRSCTRPRRSRA